MNIVACILKIYPDWKGVVWDNQHGGIRPHELETRPIPSLADLEAVWPDVEAEMANETAIQAEMKRLAEAKAVQDRETAIASLQAAGKIS